MTSKEGQEQTILLETLLTLMEGQDQIIAQSWWQRPFCINLLSQAPHLTATNNTLRLQGQPTTQLDSSSSRKQAWNIHKFCRESCHKSAHKILVKQAYLEFCPNEQKI